MTMRAGFNLHHSDLQEFLFAPIWNEKNGTPLSILSALARLGMDPWGEAARLADMPRAGAASALAAILAKLPPGMSRRCRITREILAASRAAPARRRLQAAGRRGRERVRRWRHGGPPASMVSVQNIALILALAAALVALQVNGWLL